MKKSTLVALAAFVSLLLVSFSVSHAADSGRWEGGVGPSFNVSGHGVSFDKQSWYKGNVPGFYPAYWGSDPGPANAVGNRLYGLDNPGEAWVNAEGGSPTTHLVGYDSPQPFRRIDANNVSFIAVQEFTTVTDCPNTRPGSLDSGDRDRDNIGLYAHLGRSWSLLQSDDWRWGADLGFNWNPMEGASSYYGTIGKKFAATTRTETVDVFTGNVAFPDAPYSGTAGSTLVVNNIPTSRTVTTSTRQNFTDYYSSALASFDGNMFTFYPGVTLGYEKGITKSGRTMAYGGFKTGPAFHLLSGDYALRETLYTAKDGGAYGRYGSREGKTSDSDFGVGAFAMGSVGLRGPFSKTGKMMWDVSVSVIGDFLGSDLKVGGAEVETSGARIVGVLGVSF